MKTKKELR